MQITTEHITEEQYKLWKELYHTPQEKIDEVKKKYEEYLNLKEQEYINKK